MTAVVIGSIANLTTYLTTNVVHPTYFPYLLAHSLHAARISIAFQTNVRLTKNQGKLSWGAYLVGFLIMAWGGTLTTHVLLGIPPPPLYSIHPWINYLAIHIALIALCHLFPSALSPRIYDSILFIPDAVLRVGSISAALDLVHTHPDPRLSQSLLLRLLIGAVASAGGGVTAATLNVWTPEWKLSTPVFLRSGAGVLGTLDVWSGSLAAAVYGLALASHPVYQHLLVSWSITDRDRLGPVVSPLGAKAVATVLLAALYAWRVVMLHWVVPARPTTAVAKKTKTQ